jgi:hypothetical protein
MALALVGGSLVWQIQHHDWEKLGDGTLVEVVD